MIERIGTLALSCGLLCVAACAEGSIAEDAGDDAVAAEAEALLEGAQTVGIVLKLLPTNKAPDVELRKWWEATAPVLRRIPKNAVVVLGAAKPRRAKATDPYWYQVAHAGSWGWIRATEVEELHGAQPTLSQERRDALQLGRSAMGFSYWWSNARWLTTGPTTWPTKNVGACGGTCGGAAGCTHKSTLADGVEYGADCSGFVSTVWGFQTTTPTRTRRTTAFRPRRTRAIGAMRGPRSSSTTHCRAMRSSATTQRRKPGTSFSSPKRETTPTT